MEKEFWKHPLDILFFWPLCALISISTIITGIILAIKSSELLPILYLGLFLIFICVLGVFVEPKTLSKVIFTDEEICVKRFNKVIASIKWCEIIEIKGYCYSISARYMSFISSDTRIDIDPTKKMYDAIMSICPYASLRNMIEDIDMFKCFHKNKSKTNQD